MTHSLKFAEQVKWHIRPASSEAVVYAPWHADLLKAVSGFSDFILKQAELRQYPEIIALAFWFRASHLTKLAESGKHQITDTQPTNANKVFHIAPANVDTVFLYSVLLSVLTGNQNIVRVSERSGDVTWVLVELLKHYLAMPVAKPIKDKIAITQYSSLQETVTEQFSVWADLRVVWGGDNAIEAVSKIAPGTRQICFPDRFSIAVIQLTDKDDIQAVAQAFLTDILPFNQQACSSPKAIYWLNTPDNIQHAFWQTIKEQLKNKEHQLGLSNKVEQHILLQKLAAAQAIELNDNSGNKIASFAKIQSIGQLGRAKVKTLTAQMLAQHTGNGLVFEMDIQADNELPFAEKLQTISLFGNVGAKLNKESGMFKRIAPLGKALEFNPVWDGIDLIKSFLSI
ncbi:hypothetical protein N7931_03790 [Catenovulum sp. 2E275]|uniref:acyl-CoA reductase n=1 Tax=Catenovulum sp. 2E275 TaxID=2980497 RepID=UPI0021D3C086|nr:acyl-CoA reductase [Catenovulum sp. 2E275]MCU4674749.1 hypothetical protein [Catenovulum sp. 2E275]